MRPETFGRVCGLVGSPAHNPAGRHHEREDDVQAASDKVGGHLFDTHVRLVAYAPKGHRRLAQARLRTMAGAFGSFTVSRLAMFRAVPVRRSRRPRPFLLSHEELATLWHPPTAIVGLAHLQATEFTELEAPTILNARKGDGTAGGAVLGRAKYRSEETVVELAPDDRRRHLYVVGKTGMGKTTLLENQIAADVRAGRGVCLIDPHGDLAERVTELIPPQRTNEVVLFDPSDPDYAVAYVDEFQNFTTGSFATILSEARKYRLNLTVAHQYLSQLDPRTLNAVFGNVGSLVSFQVGSDDAETLALQFSKHAGQLRPQDLANLPKYTGYARILVKGLPTAPFSIRTLPPVEPVDDRRAVVRDASRRQFAQPITVVRQHLQREMALAG